MLKAASIKHLESKDCKIAEKHEAEQAELEQLRKAAAEQGTKDREAQIAREAAASRRVKEAEQAGTLVSVKKQRRTHCS